MSFDFSGKKSEQVGGWGQVDRKLLRGDIRVGGILAKLT